MSNNTASLLTSQTLSPTVIARALEDGNECVDAYLGEDIYCSTDPDYLKSVRRRLAACARLHSEKVGDKPTVLLRAPGRLNAFLEYLDMCSGDHMSTTIDGDLPVCVSVRDDDLVRVLNSNPEFQGGEFAISEELRLFRSASWAEHSARGLEDNWDNRTRLYPHYKHPKGDWLNYIRCPFLRVAWEMPDVTLRGVDMTFGESAIPMRAGVSSSSALVVLSFLALHLANADSLSEWDIERVCTMLGEAEWYVGTHGGANDHTTILRCFPNGILYNRHSQPQPDSTPVPNLQGVKMIVASSLWEASKALNANHVFNLRKGWMDVGDDLMKVIIAAVSDHLCSGGTTHPGWLSELLKDRFAFKAGADVTMLETHVELWETIARNYAQFGSLHESLLRIPNEAIEELIRLLPAEISVDEAGRILGKDTLAMERDYTLPYPDEGGYRPRSAAVFFHKENLIGRVLETIMTEADRRLKSGERTVDSPDYARYQEQVGNLLDKLQNTLRDDFQVSNSQLDAMLEIARRGPGYLGGKLTGAGCGGCVTIMVREGKEQEFCEHLDRHYYGKASNFDHYREAIAALEPELADRLRNNLDTALENVESQRRAVTFSAGAGVVDVARCLGTEKQALA